MNFFACCFFFDFFLIHKAFFEIIHFDDEINKRFYVNVIAAKFENEIVVFSDEF